MKTVTAVLCGTHDIAQELFIVFVIKTTNDAMILRSSKFWMDSNTLAYYGLEAIATTFDSLWAVSKVGNKLNCNGY